MRLGTLLQMAPRMGQGQRHPSASSLLGSWCPSTLLQSRDEQSPLKQEGNQASPCSCWKLLGGSHEQPLCLGCVFP